MRSALLGFLAAVLMVVGLAGPHTAGAHTALTVSDPAADSVLATGPTRITATFNEPLLKPPPLCHVAARIWVLRAPSPTRLPDLTFDQAGPCTRSQR